MKMELKCFALLVREKDFDEGLGFIIKESRKENIGILLANLGKTRWVSTRKVARSRNFYTSSAILTV
jgi:hypothetical protein